VELATIQLIARCKEIPREIVRGRIEDSCDVQLAKWDHTGILKCCMSDRRRCQYSLNVSIRQARLKTVWLPTFSGHVVRFAPQLWNELRFWELLDIQQSADEQLSYYYSRPR
jgi:hypothetical protein